MLITTLIVLILLCLIYIIEVIQKEIRRQRELRELKNEIEFEEHQKDVLDSVEKGPKPREFNFRRKKRRSKFIRWR